MTGAPRRCLVTGATDSTWTVVGQAVQALPDAELRGVVASCTARTTGQLARLTTRIEVAAPRAFLVAG